MVIDDNDEEEEKLNIDDLAYKLEVFLFIILIVTKEM